MLFHPSERVLVLRPVEQFDRLLQTAPDESVMLLGVDERIRPAIHLCEEDMLLDFIDPGMRLPQPFINGVRIGVVDALEHDGLESGLFDQLAPCGVREALLSLNSSGYTLPEASATRDPSKQEAFRTPAHGPDGIDQDLNRLSNVSDPSWGVLPSQLHPPCTRDDRLRDMLCSQDIET